MEVKLSYHDVLPLVTKFLRQNCDLPKIAKKIEKKESDAPYASVLPHLSRLSYLGSRTRRSTTNLSSKSLHST